MTPRYRSLLASIGTFALVAGSLAAPQSASAAPVVPGDVTLVSVRHSLLGTHSWYRQTYRGVPVLGGFYAVHTTSSGATTIDDGRLAVPSTLTTAAKVDRNRAQRTTAARAGGAVTSSELVVVPGEHPTLAWRVLDNAGHGARQTLVDAGSGEVIKTESLVKEADGSGRVFSPNAVVTLQNEGLKDNNDADSPAFSGAYQTVALHQLDDSGALTGAYADNISDGAVTSAEHVFAFDRSQPGFEQVMAYHAITSAQEYIHSLGFTDVNNSAQKFTTTGFTDDNSFYDPTTDEITFGTGGVDDAEDAEVIWHEYGHAIQDDQIPGFGSSTQAGSIGEGFGDYWAYTMSIPVSADTAVTPLACIADWDSVSYTSTTPHCLRRVDGTKVFPADRTNEVHADGEIWSRALFDIHAALGRTATDTLILEAQFGFAPNTTFAAAAQKIVATARTLYGDQAAVTCTAALHARGFI